MSGYLAGKVWHSNLSGNLKPLAACLADLGGQDGSGIFPSVEYLMWLLSWGESTVRAGMSKLKQDGILIAVTNESGGRGKIPIYRMNVSKLPQRDPWKKGLKSEPFTLKGPDSGNKGSRIRDRYKEEPLEDQPLALSSPSESTGDTSSKKESKTDPRHQEFIEALDQGYKTRAWQFGFSGADGAKLKELLKLRPQWTVKEFRSALRNYFKSEGVVPGDLPRRYLTRLPTYESGPLDRFGKAAKGVDRIASIAEVNRVYEQ